MVFSNKEYLLSQNLIAHFPFNNNTNDISGNNNNGKIIGGVTATSDRFDNPCGAFTFNGTDGYIEVPNSNSLQSITQTFSVACWFKIENVPLLQGIKWLTLICKGNQSIETNNIPQYRVQTLQSAMQSTISINTDFTEYDNNFSNHSFEFNKWNFYVLVYDGSFVKTYLNSIKIWEYPYNKFFSQNTDPLHIGKDIPGSLEFFCGSLDDLRIYNSPLSDSDITKLFKDDSGLSFDDEFTLTCPSNITTQTDINKCTAIVNYPKPLLNINCGSAILKQISGLTSGSEFPVGISFASFQASSNSGFTKTCTFKIIVNDKELPTINCPNDTILLINDVTKNDIAYSYQLPFASDKCSPVSIQMINGIASGSAFPIGTTQLKFKATDKAANSVECIYNVIVKKNVVPAENIVPVQKKDTLFCPLDIKKFNDSNKCGAIVNYTINENENQIKLIEGNKTGSFFPVGTTINKYSNINSQSACTFSVSVIDNEKPELICPADIIAHVTDKEKTIKVNYSTPIANDNCSIDSLIQIEGIKSGGSFAIGATQNVFKAIDTFGNSTICSFNVLVVDTTKKQTLSNDSTELKTDLIPDSIRYTKPMQFKTCILTVIMYDDSQQDYDSISVFFNHKEIVSHEMLKIKKNGTINRALMLNEYEKNDFIVKAWNNGEISPNTLKIEFYEGYYLDRMKKIKNKKPDLERTLHSKPGVAAGIYLNCKNQ